MNLTHVLELDIRGENPNNKFQMEKINIESKDCPYLIPDASPFFNDPSKTIVYNQNGGELVLNRDYWLVEEFLPLCEISGKSVVCFIKLSEKTLEENDSISITYQSIGAYFVPRNSLNEWKSSLNRGKIPIDFTVKAVKLPEFYRSSRHLHNIKEELTDWHELTYFFHILGKLHSTNDYSRKDRAEQLISEAYAEAYARKPVLMAQLLEHDKDYNNPHGITKEHLGLGNVDNFRTATVAEDVLGNRNDLLSTPAGVIAAVRAKNPEMSDIMRAGIIPVSSFGTGANPSPDITRSGWVINIPAGIRVLMAGTNFVTKTTTVDLRDIEENPRNKTFYLFVTVRGESLSFTISTVRLRKTIKNVLISIITTTTSGVGTLENRKTFNLGGYDLSQKREGGIIPVSSGLSQDEGSFRFLRASELLP